MSVRLDIEASNGRRARRERHSVRRLNRIAKFMGASSYLEIGVGRGHTFNSVDLPRKVAVDPRFKFDPQAHRRKGVDFFEITSDAFFAQLAGTEKFDLIFIDGLHVFPQAYRDFCNSLGHAHDRTVLLIDDVIPINEMSSLPDRREVRRRRREGGIDCRAWHGDVYKVIFAIHDFHPTYSFVTANTGGNPQAIVWKAERQSFAPVLGSMEAIKQLGYDEFLQRKELMTLRSEEDALQLLFASINSQRSETG